MLKHKLTPTRKAKWLELLRSKDYEQINGKLRNNTNGRCCLGVYVDANKAKWWNSDALWSTEYALLNPTIDVSDTDLIGRVLPKSEGKVFLQLVPDKIQSKYPEFVEKHEPEDRDVETLLAYFNDDLGWSFRKIARWIDTHL